MSWRLPTRLENVMTPFVVFIYLCAASTAPADCDRRTAIDVALGPQAANELMCGLGAQEMMAQTAIRPKDRRILQDRVRAPQSCCWELTKRTGREPEPISR